MAHLIQFREMSDEALRAEISDLMDSYYEHIGCEDSDPTARAEARTMAADCISAANAARAVLAARA